jgi:hypothetical protein
MGNNYTNIREKIEKLEVMKKDLYEKIEIFFGHKVFLTMSIDFESGVTFAMSGTSRKVHSLKLGDRIKEDDGLNNIRKGIEKRNNFEKILGEGTEIIWQTFFDVETMRWITKETSYYIKTHFCNLKEIENRIILIEKNDPVAAKKINRQKKMMEMYNIKITGSPLSDEIESEIAKIVESKSRELQITLLLMDDKINNYINEALKEARQMVLE